ncbi:MAG: hypothetical protein IJL62_08090 [Clostridia bacterium]|nr:hypothetical protein [Clostridia bacterium]
MSFRNRLYRFMEGRNGVDALSVFINRLSFGWLFGAILFTFLSILFMRRDAAAASTVFRVLYFIAYGLGLILLILWFFRVFSKNVAKRQAENTRYQYRMQKLRRKRASVKQQWKDRKTYKYFRCPQCRQKMRAPRHKGRIRVTCSKCSHVFITKT